MLNSFIQKLTAQVENVEKSILIIQCNSVKIRGELLNYKVT